MAATRRFLLSRWAGALGLAILGIRLVRPPSTASGIVITEDGWVLRKSDLDLLR